MKHYLFTTAFALLAMFSAYGSDVRVSLRVETLHRIATENAASLEGCRILGEKGCRILGEHVVEMVSSPEKLGKAIAHTMVSHLSILRKKTWPFSYRMSNRPALFSDSDKAAFRSIGDSVREYRRQLRDTGHFDIDKFIGTVEELREHAVKKHVVAGLTPPYSVTSSDILLKTANTYKNALNSGTGFILTIKEKASMFRTGSRETRRMISIGRLVGTVALPIVGVLAEFFFAEPLEAATLDDFDVEVSPEEYELFYAAVEMERDRLLPYLENSDNPEDRDLALEIRSEIEERE